jgi:hypothetical protein
LALNAIGGALKISNQFKGTVDQTIALSDTIRKLGSVFGIASNDFTTFETNVTKGLGDIGLSSEVAVNSLKGLSQTQVRGQKNLIEYSKTAGELGSVTGQKGQEGDIAKLMAETITSKGGNVNDVAQMRDLATATLKIFNSTGIGAKESLQSMKDLFTGMSKDFREKLSPQTAGQLAIQQQIAGPNSTKFLEEFLSKSPVARMGLESRGFKDIYTEKGFDIEKFKASAGKILGEFKGDPRLMATTLGLTEEAAEGFLRLNDTIDKQKSALDIYSKATGNLGNQFHTTMTLAESFAANLNKVKAAFASPLAIATQKATEIMTKTSEKSSGAIATTVAAGGLAALLAGGAFKAIGGMFGSKVSGLTEAATIETATGRTVQPVYVVNASEISQRAGSAGTLTQGPLAAVGKVASSVGQAAMVGGVIYEGAQLANQYGPQVGLPSGEKGGVIDYAGQKLRDVGKRLTGGETFSDLDKKQQEIDKRNAELQNKINAQQGGKQQEVKVKVEVESKSPDIKVKTTQEQRRGGSY